MKRLPTTCPSCRGLLRVARLRCPACDSAVEGDFSLGVLARLDDEEQQLVVNLVKASGSLKDLAALYSVSYPTIRNRVDALIDRIRRVEKDIANEKEPGHVR